MPPSGTPQDQEMHEIQPGQSAPGTLMMPSPSPPAYHEVMSSGAPSSASVQPESSVDVEAGGSRHHRHHHHHHHRHRDGSVSSGSSGHKTRHERIEVFNFVKCVILAVT